MDCHTVEPWAAYWGRWRVGANRDEDACPTYNDECAECAPLSGHLLLAQLPHPVSPTKRTTWDLQPLRVPRGRRGGPPDPGAGPVGQGSRMTGVCAVRGREGRHLAAGHAEAGVARAHRWLRGGLRGPGLRYRPRALHRDQPGLWEGQVSRRPAAPVDGRLRDGAGARRAPATGDGADGTAPLPSTPTRSPPIRRTTPTCRAPVEADLRPEAEQAHRPQAHDHR